MSSASHLLMLLVALPAVLAASTIVKIADPPAEHDVHEVTFHEDCSKNTTICNPAEMLQCVKDLCQCENGSAWEETYHTCRPLSSDPPHPMSWGKIAIIVGFSLAVLVLVLVFVIRKRMKDTSFKPTLEERRRSVFVEAHGDIPMKQRKFSQHFA